MPHGPYQADDRNQAGSEGRRAASLPSPPCLPSTALCLPVMHHNLSNTEILCLASSCASTPSSQARPSSCCLSGVSSQRGGSITRYRRRASQRRSLSVEQDRRQTATAAAMNQTVPQTDWWRCLVSWGRAGRPRCSLLPHQPAAAHNMSRQPRHATAPALCLSATPATHRPI